MVPPAAVANPEGYLRHALSTLEHSKKFVLVLRDTLWTPLLANIYVLPAAAADALKREYE